MAKVKITEQEWETFLGAGGSVGNRCADPAEGGCAVSRSGGGRPCPGTSSRSSDDGTAGLRAGGTSHGPAALPDLRTALSAWCIGTGLWKPLTVRLNFTNRSAIARLVAEIFFPQRPALGLDQRTYSPAVVDKIVSANAEHKSTYKAQKMLEKLAELSVSVPEILDLSSMIGQELREHLEEQAAAHAAQTLEPQYCPSAQFGGRLHGWRSHHDARGRRARCT